LGTERELVGLIGQIYEAAASPDGLARLCSVMAPYFGTASSIIHTCTESSLEMRSILSATENFERWAWSAYAEHYHDRNVWFQRGIRKGPSVVVICEELVSNRELLRSEWYDYCQKVDWFHCLGIGASIAKDLVGGIGFHRPRSAKPFDEADRRKAQFVLPHLERALQINHRIARLTHERNIAFEVMDGLAVGILFLEFDTRILFANRVAERILKKAYGLSVLHGRLRVEDRNTSDHLERLVGEAAQTSAGNGISAGGVLSIATPNDRQLFLLVSPFRSMSTGYGPALPAAIVIFSDPESQAAVSQQTLQKLFDLTPAQARLLVAVLDGQGLSAYAETTGISINTAKTLMQQVFLKTGHHRQIDLVRAIAADPVIKLVRRGDRRKDGPP
jgi:DNA-binding CsgD family transcriptional regulator